MLLVCLSGVTAEAKEENTTFYVNNTTGKLYAAKTDVKDDKRSEVTLKWEILNNEIQVEPTAVWDPAALSYSVTSVSVTNLCTPTLNVTIENNCAQYYVSSTVIVKPEKDVSIRVATYTNVTRTDVALKWNKTGKVYEIVKKTANATGETAPLLKEYVDRIEAVPPSSTDSIAIGPWLTAAQRDYCELTNADPETYTFRDDWFGSSKVSFAFSLESEVLLKKIRNTASWTNLTFDGGNPIKIASVTILLQMIDIPDDYKVKED